jgi:hypothetical protein
MTKDQALKPDDFPIESHDEKLLTVMENRSPLPSHQRLLRRSPDG